MKRGEARTISRQIRTIASRMDRIGADLAREPAEHSADYLVEVVSELCEELQELMAGWEE